MKVYNQGVLALGFARAQAPPALQMTIPEELKKKSDFLAVLRERTDPNKKHTQEALSMKIAPPIASIRAKLELAKQYMAEVDTSQLVSFPTEQHLAYNFASRDLSGMQTSKPRAKSLLNLSEKDTTI